MPDQIVGYMMQQGIKPMKQEWIQVDQAIQNAPVEVVPVGAVRPQNQEAAVTIIIQQ